VPGRPPRPTLLYVAVGVLSWPVLYGLFRLRAAGREHLPEGGYVLAANHISNLDPWPLGMPLFPQRFLRFMAKSELFWPPLSWFISGVGAFRVRRGERDLEAIETAIGLCREGHVVVMFPEGTRRRKGLRKKWEARAHTGAARIALGAGVPLVPAGIAGTDRIARLPRLRVVYGPPVPLADVASREDAPLVATERLMEAIRRLEVAARGRSERQGT